MIALIKNAENVQTLEPSFVSKVLAPYFDHTTYLKDVTVTNRPRNMDTFDGPRNVSRQVCSAVENSCYIQSTGHFNAVEFNICFNQLAYATYAHCFETSYFQQQHPEWGDRLKMFNPATFQRKQLSSMLIVNLSSKFKKEIRGKHFYGELEIGKMPRPGTACSAPTISPSPTTTVATPKGM